MDALNRALRAGDWAAAEALLLKITKKEKRNPEPHFHLGMVLRRQGRETEAARAFEKALKINPNLPQVQFERGQALMAAGDYREAKRAFLAALKAAPGDVGCRANLAMIARLQGDLDAAIAEFDRLLAEPGLEENQAGLVHLSLVEALRDRRDYDRMREEGRALGQRQPTLRSAIIRILTEGKSGRFPLRASEI
ncbi:tetratricopeptide repeat protein [Lutibaculum baratangense]|uniref:TPR repeat protein n=1 Tax=Lutibaculum baratangense AMV1 TaxID=631454 RepID=V4RNV3_9HYPH|nr:tetratricopeptide repeat protein [Lutibaculum baratangense]ESR26924.1 TPR repeat protein [Lutibaculum baratangense AMV1]